MTEKLHRRDFVAATAAAGLAAAMGGRGLAAADAPAASGKPAIPKPAALGGKPARDKPFPRWPVTGANDEKAILETLRGGQWYRGGAAHVDAFEAAFAKRTGAKHCIATSGGTTALIAALGALGVGPGDEVLVTPYTFIASITSIMMHFALPVFVDVDPETFLIDPGKIEAAITDRTAAIMPVHIGGSVSNMDAVLDVAKRHNLPVIEDACQAHLAEWRGRPAGTWGTAGCFSFQVSKNLCSGEGGAVLTDDDDLAERIFAFHNNCRARNVASYHFSYVPNRAANFRMTEFQGALLTAQMTRLEEQCRRRDENAKYLTGLLSEIPGIQPAKRVEGCTRNAWHLYMFRYDPEPLAGLSRGKFLEALSAEGIPCSGGYEPVPWAEFLKEAYGTRGARRVFPDEVLARWPERCGVPEHERLCREAVWFMQYMFLGPKSDMDQIAEAVRKIHAHAAELAKA